MVGETKRTFYGMQLFDVAPGLLEQRVAVWLPEVSVTSRPVCEASRAYHPDGGRAG